MPYILILEKRVIEDIAKLKKSGNQATINKIAQLLTELTNHPTTGTGQIEQLRGRLSGFWSRSEERRVGKEC